MFEADVLIAALTVFVLAIFIGYEVITKVPPTLHTPLMSGSNAISGIVIVGALLVAGKADGLTGQILGAVAVGLAMIFSIHSRLDSVTSPPRLPRPGWVRHTSGRASA